MDAHYRLARAAFVAVLSFTSIVIVAPKVHRETAATDLQPEFDTWHRGEALGKLLNTAYRGITLKTATESIASRIDTTSHRRDASLCRRWRVERTLVRFVTRSETFRGWPGGYQDDNIVEAVRIDRHIGERQVVRQRRSSAAMPTADRSAWETRHTSLGRVFGSCHMNPFLAS
jgi:hypothetical protein